MANVTVKMSSENAELVRGWLEARRGVEGFSQELDKAGRKGKAAGKDIAGGMQSGSDVLKGAIGNVSKFAAAVTGVGSALAVVATVGQMMKSEYEAWLARNKEAGVKQVDFGKELEKTRDVFLNNQSSFGIEQLAKEAVGNTSQVPAGELIAAFREASGEAGDYDLKDVWKLTKSSAELAPSLDLDSRTALVRAALLNAKEFGASPEQAMAGSLTTFAASNTKDVRSFAENVAPTIKGLHQLGTKKDSYEDLAAFALTFNQMTGDPTGQRGRTGQGAFLKQLMTETMKAGLVGGDASPLEALRAAQGSADIQKKLLGVFAPQGANEMEKNLKNKKLKGEELTGEEQQFAAAKGILTNSEEYQKQIAAMRAKRPSLDDAAVAEVRAREAELNRVPQMQAQQASRLKEIAALKNQLNNPQGARSAVLDLQEKIDEIATQSTMTTWGRDSLRRFGLDNAPGTGTLQGARDQAAEAADWVGMIDKVNNRVAPDKVLSPADLATRNELRDIVRALDALLEETKAANAVPKPVVIKGDARPAAPVRAGAGMVKD